jgi:hypothetical protein
MNWTTGLENAWAAVIPFVPAFIAVQVVLLVGHFVARWLGKLATKAAQKAGIDRWLERGGMRATLENSGFGAGTLLGKLIYYTCMLFVLQLAFGFFGPNPISALIERFIAFLPNIFVALAIVVVAVSVAAAVKDIIQASLGGLDYGRFLAAAAYTAILVIGVFAALDQLAIAPAIINGLFYALLAIVAGSAIVAIGGGGIQPMRAQWEKALSRVEEEAPRVQAQLQAQAAPPDSPMSPMEAQERDLQKQLEHTKRVYDSTPNLPG